MSCLLERDRGDGRSCQRIQSEPLLAGTKYITDSCGP